MAKKKRPARRAYKQKKKVVKIIIEYPPGSVKVVVIRGPQR